MKLATIKDYRKPRGSRLSLSTLILSIFLTELAGIRSLRTREIWLSNHWEKLKPILNIQDCESSPSDSTLCRVLNKINENNLQLCVSKTIQLMFNLSKGKENFIHYALDGKSRCGVRSELTGRTEIDLTLFETKTSAIVGKMTLPDKQGRSNCSTFINQ